MDLDETPELPPKVLMDLMANAKGKGKASSGTGNGNMSDAEVKAIREREGLPWSVSVFSFLPRTPEEMSRLNVKLTDIRVEKYRPNTLDEVVSHKDITSTS